MPTIGRGPGAPPSPARDASGTADATRDAGASPTAGADAARERALDRVEPRPAGADGYVLQFDRWMTTDATVDGQSVRIDTAADGRRASYLAEVGKPLRVDVDPALFTSDSIQKLELVYGLRGSADRLGRVVVNEGERDARTGALVMRPALIDLPDDIAGTLDLSFESTLRDGSVRSRWNPHYGVTLVPKEGATLSFDEDWSAEASGAVQAGQRLEIAYDADRMRELAGDDAAGLVAYVAFDGEEPLALPLSIDAGDGGSQHDGTFFPAVRVPYDARRVAVWFRGRGSRGEAWDSKFGKNYTFDVAVARADADPSWKRLLVGSPGFPGLRDDTFVAIGPSDGGYNCIAWTVNNRDEWVWPGERVADFDRLYEEHGYRAADDLDTSHEPGVEKIALYGIETPGGSVSVTHGALMDQQGRWTSKMGTNPLIRHEDVAAVAGPSYGKLIRVYARPRASGHV